jgi:hypothetical protein
VSAAPVVAAGALMLLDEHHALNFQSYEADALAARNILARLTALGPVKTREDMHERVEVASKLGVALRGLEDTRQKAVGPLNSQVRDINAMFKAVSEPAEAAVDVVKRHKRAWDEQERAREQREREELQRRQREAAEAEASALRKAEEAKTAKGRAKALVDAAAASEAQAIAAAEAPTPAAVVLKGDYGSMGVRKVWLFEVVRADLVPAEYLSVDEKKIRAAVAAGVRTIAGVNITEDEQQVSRVRG